MTSPKTTEYAPILYISRDVLPESTDIGDEIAVQGARYKVISLDANSLSREKNSGYVATLELIPPKSSDKEPKTTSYTS